MHSAPLPSTAGLADTAPDAPPLIRRFASKDVDTHAERTHGWSIRLDQLSPGPFRGTLHEIRFDGMQLLRERVNRALLKRGDQCAGRTSFSIPLETAGDGFCGGAPLRDKALLVSGGTSLPELRTPDHQDVVLLTVPNATLRQLAWLGDRDENGDGVSSSETRILRVPSARHDALTALLVAGFEAADTPERPLARPHTRKSLRDAILVELMHATEAAGRPVRLDPSARHRVVDRVRELVAARPDVPLTVLDVCREVGASRRKLQYCFEEILGTHPAWYLRVLRLNAVRRELREHSPASASVSDVACRWGFWHLSRFASHYRELFGELPSDTLKRAPR
ncbi:helix-turn-helix domain-containing protein [Burkholderia sp. AU45388]|uniref:helix-turn-helix domain-containing protein n=1 Tax=Burkholderia sp. AU45388 TaxID=3059206 RepID=UPI002651516C|nr:helix-turn-helix domain-containing protein [Burkholderia sp. AU45388]MDN7425079.1 helix-turn-helix domain-containing protein [Burkholderia sp. AU45388]